MFCSAEIQQLLQLRRPFVVAERVFRDEARAICAAFADKDNRRGRALFRKFEAGAELPPELALALALIAAELERLATSPSLKHIDDALALAGNKYIDRRAAEKRLGCALHGLGKEAREIAEFGSIGFRYRDAGEVIYFHEDQIARAIEARKARLDRPRPLRIRFSQVEINPDEYMTAERLIKAIGMKQKAFRHAKERRGKYLDLPFWPQPRFQKGRANYYAVADVKRFITWLYSERDRVADGTYISRQAAAAVLGISAKGGVFKRLIANVPLAFRDPRSQSFYHLAADIERLKAERERTLYMGVAAHGL